LQISNECSIIKIENILKEVDIVNDYKKYIIELINKIEDEKTLKKIYAIINRIFVRGG
jgi:hypothetical protein